MDVSVLIPLSKPLDPQRTRLFNWVWKRWLGAMMQLTYDGLRLEFELVEGYDRGKPFSKAAAVNDAFRRASGTVLVVTDADSWLRQDALARGLDAARQRSNLVVPWHVVYYLTPEDTEEVLAAPVPDDVAVDLSPERVARASQGPHQQTAGVLYMIRRDGFELIGGMDPRFRGWGGEDRALYLAASALLGEVWHEAGVAYQLHHERPEANGMRVWSDDSGGRNLDLAERYAAADRREMEALIRERT